MKNIVRIIEEKQENNLREWKWEKERSKMGQKLVEIMEDKKKSSSSITGIYTHIYTHKMKSK